MGRAFAGTEIMIAGDGEILTRGPLNTPGYLNRPDLTAELIDAEGWLHTGDIGRLDDDGFLSVVDRKKELIITAGGENVPPAAVENLLVAHPLIGQALAYGDRRPYVVALLTLDAEVAPAWAGARGIEAGSLAELAQNPVLLAEIEEAVAAANQQLARVQQVKRWRLLPVEWTAESEELTPTLKLKRRVVHAKYSDDIDTLYGAADKVSSGGVWVPGGPPGLQNRWAALRVAGGFDSRPPPHSALIREEAGSEHSAPGLLLPLAAGVSPYPGFRSAAA